LCCYSEQFIDMLRPKFEIGHSLSVLVGHYPNPAIQVA
jgi:hypothetical protein